MRIAFDNYNALLDIIEQNQLAVGDFELQSDKVDSLVIKYRHDYFSFSVLKEGPDVYQVEIRNTLQVAPSSVRVTWGSLINHFANWSGTVKHDADQKLKFMHRYAHRELPSLLGVTERFNSIFRQAEIAETYRLDEICGLGYRKAFEIMIKEYLMNGRSEKDANRIKEMNVSACVNEFVANDEIKILASRVLWLGNDHAHYLKKFPDHGIAELKKLIDKAITWIMNHEEWKRLQEAMVAEARTVEAALPRNGA